MEVVVTSVVMSALVLAAYALGYHNGCDATRDVYNLPKPKRRTRNE